ncbi:TPA: PTS sugar transporter subunit IIA [Vibrio vulnificus]|nr:PTS sugar transporter subunit IIA [Vibrio vulnificus]
MGLKQSLIENNSIKLQAQASNWRDAIKIGTDMLIALPHARPENGVNRTAFALVTLETPIYFDGEDEPVDVLITLAGSSSDEHMEGLMEVTQVLDDEESDTGVDLDKLRRCRSLTDVFNVIDDALAMTA